MNSLPADFPHRARQTGSAVVVLIALLAIMALLAAVNSKVLFHLHRELRFLEQKQIERLGASQTKTNSIAAWQAGPNRNEHGR